MLEIAFLNAQPLVRRALIGARADDPIVPEKRQRWTVRSPRTKRRGTS